MTHYICNGGCNGVSEDEAATCQATDCINHTKPLITCECTDAKHNVESDKISEE